jgi:hypothetical protein
MSRRLVSGAPTANGYHFPIENHDDATFPGAQPAPDGGGAWAGAPPDSFAFLPMHRATGNRRLSSPDHWRRCLPRFCTGTDVVVPFSVSAAAASA